jgi:1,4-alpha-glucan branching enzyme
MTMTKATVTPQEINAILNFEHPNPFEVLGMHEIQYNKKKALVVRAFFPEVEQAIVHDIKNQKSYPMTRINGDGFFEVIFPNRQKHFPYQIETIDIQGKQKCFTDVFSFSPILSDDDLKLFKEGKHYTLYEKLGCHLMTLNGVSGAFFAVWAPNAKRVSIVGDFNRWDKQRHPMRFRKDAGVWELFIPGVKEGDCYKYEIEMQSKKLCMKSDPCGFQYELRPEHASIVTDLDRFAWTDRTWMLRRKQSNPLERPISVYEVHLGSWMRPAKDGTARSDVEEGNPFLSYRELADRLIPYVRDMGFTHIELLPITEHPFDASWGYQVTGYYAPTSRHGTPEDLMFFVNTCHQEGIGVILDWVPSHFPKDDHALSNFDGTSLYEYEDPWLRDHKNWGTLIFDYEKNEVKNFLLASALFWFEKFHIDGIRVDAVSSMLYLDYGRGPGEWIPNKFGGPENLAAIDFLKELNTIIHEQFPGTITIAEESTSWLGVTRPTYLGGLGFTFKWNLGWMHDTLRYISHDPIYRKYVHNMVPLVLLYAFHEHFVLPLSHDEVVHCKKSLIGKMPGDRWQKFANLRVLYGFMLGHPGKKLLFMGDEFGQENEWDHDNGLDWNLLQHDLHQGLQKYIRDLNHLYVSEPALFLDDAYAQCFEWIDIHNFDHSVFAFMRKTLDEDPQILIFLCNFTPVPRHNYRVGVPLPGYYREIFNSDAEVYGGKNIGNANGSYAEPIPWQTQAYSVCLTLPPLSTIILKPEVEKLLYLKQEGEQMLVLHQKEPQELRPKQAEKQGELVSQEESQELRPKQEEEQISSQKQESRLRRVFHGYNYPYG